MLPDLQLLLWDVPRDTENGRFLIQSCVLQHNAAQNCPYLWVQHGKMCATNQSKDTQKSFCCIYSVLSVIWEASRNPPVQMPQPGCTWPELHTQRLLKVHVSPCTVQTQPW